MIKVTGYCRFPIRQRPLTRSGKHVARNFYYSACDVICMFQQLLQQITMHGAGALRSAGAGAPGSFMCAMAPAYPGIFLSGHRVAQCDNQRDMVGRLRHVPFFPVGDGAQQPFGHAGRQQGMVDA